jgi:hypothetical protein
MVDRVYQRNTSDSAPQPPTDPSIGYPTGGNPAQGVPATIPGPYWYHMITESLRRVVVAAGLEPDYVNLDRLKDAVRQAATGSVAGIMKLATQTQVDAGEDDATAVTPKKLRWGFSYSFGQAGYVFLPSWLGGFVAQWGKYTSSSTGKSPGNFPVAFPNQYFGSVGTFFGGFSGIDTANVKIEQNNLVSFNFATVNQNGAFSSSPLFLIHLGY